MPRACPGTEIRPRRALGLRILLLVLPCPSSCLRSNPSPSSAAARAPAPHSPGKSPRAAKADRLSQLHWRMPPQSERRSGCPKVDGVTAADAEAESRPSAWLMRRSSLTMSPSAWRTGPGSPSAWAWPTTVAVGSTVGVADAVGLTVGVRLGSSSAKALSFRSSRRRDSRGFAVQRHRGRSAFAVKSCWPGSRLRR